jgi:hypothetical protein
MHLAVWLYPRTWRFRYGAEMHALIDDVAPGWRAFIDVASGGMAMRIQTSNPAAMAAMLGMVGALLAGAGAFAAPTRFESRGTMTATLTPDGGPADGEVLLSVLGRAAESAFGAGAVPRAHIAVTRTSAPTEIQIGYADADPERAREMTDRLMTRAVEANLDPAASRSSGLQLRIITAPDLPQSPSRPYLVWVIAAGFGGGAALGTALAFIRRRTNRR